MRTSVAGLLLVAGLAAAACSKDEPAQDSGQPGEETAALSATCRSFETHFAAAGSARSVEEIGAAAEWADEEEDGDLAVYRALILTPAARIDERLAAGARVAQAATAAPGLGTDAVAAFEAFGDALNALQRGWRRPPSSLSEFRRDVFNPYYEASDRIEVLCPDTR